MENNRVFISSDILDEIAKEEAEFCVKVRNCEPIAAVKNLADHYEDSWDIIKPFIKENDKILEIGSGNGFLLCYCKKNELNIIGVEPGKNYGFEGRFARACRLLEINGIPDIEKVLIDCTAENMPFEDDSFDFIFSIAVLEHVHDVKQVIDEAIRVLKPGGIFYSNIPNYNSFYEGHYNIFWIPGIKPRFAKWYVSKVFHRDPSYINELHFLTPKEISAYIKPMPISSFILYYGKGSITGKILGLYNVVKAPENIRDLIVKKLLSRNNKVLSFCLNNHKIRLLIRLLIYLPATILIKIGFASTFSIIIEKK